MEQLQDMRTAFVATTKDRGLQSVCALQATWQPRLREALQMVREHENGAKQGDVGASQLGSTQLAGFKG